ncbi:GAF and ANTAR domain-containing protein [Streptomyces durmitorensis]|uniref:GAF and ANTAR domain-containing protein n=1 Tax=Streptomyces durmitorensis TaxID=319947 RepID=A0ABY4PRJ2_9ACTN|nr:GAF and ANTAR domain-containing protein [Streptomyces durmitorensis]UQT56356.1 GAF and ANTAR domain-containing protein [Streptomyces durmitorensis]
MSHDLTRPVSGDTSRERLLAEAFVEVADSLTDDFDVVTFLQSLAVRCVELLGVSAAGIMLAEPQGGLRLEAASGEQTWVLDLFALQQEEGPCLDCFRSGTAHTNIALGGMEAITAWPHFTARALETGYEMAQVLPLRRGDQALGTLNLLQAKPMVLGPDEIALAQALADVAMIAILQRRSLEQSEVERGQLQDALTSRIAIEQAKGVLAERWKCTVDEAFVELRRYARANRLRIAECARRVVEGELDTEGIRRV